MKSDEISDWLTVTEPYRSRLDLATIISYWLRLEEMDQNQWKRIYKKFIEVAGDCIDESFYNFDESNVKNYESYLSYKRDPKGSDGPLHIFRYQGDKDNPPVLNEDEKWWRKYRDDISKVSYFEFESFPSEEAYVSFCNEIHAYDFEEPVAPYNPIFSNRALTRRFIDLDLLLDRYDEKGWIYKDHLSMPVKFKLLDKVTYAGSTRPEKTSEKDPFYNYKLIDLVEKRLWGKFDKRTNPNKAWKHLIEVATPISDPEFTSILAALHGTTSTMANHLRLLTQPIEDRAVNGTGSGKNLKLMLKPLMRFALVSDKYSIAFWSLKAEKRRQLIKRVLGVKPGECEALLGLAVPNADIRQDVNKDGGFNNPGATPPKIIVRRAEQLVNDYLPELLNGKLKPREHDYYSDLKAAILLEK